MTMLSDFLNEHGIKAEQVVAQSSAMEHHHVADRALAAKRRMARAAKKPYAEVGADKPKGLHRGVSVLAVNRAIAGQELPRLVRKKIARAVNAILTKQKKDPAEARKLFGDVKVKKQPKKK